ncbi:MAG: hypothetical protein AVDCRST_MAG47-2021, partial [uncultured Nocardioidaceae bacterium]
RCRARGLRRRDDPGVRDRRGDRLLLGRRRRDRRGVPPLECSSCRAVHLDGGVADHDLTGAAGPRRGGRRHGPCPDRAAPRGCDRDDPRGGAKPATSRL